MKFTIIYLLILSFVSLSSCIGNGSCNQVKLLNKEKQWFSFYPISDSVYFGNDKRVEKFVVKTKSHDFTSCNKFEVGPNEYEYQGTTLNNNGFKIRIIFTKQHQDNNEPDCFKKIYVGDLHTDKLTNLNALRKEDVFVPYLDKNIQTYLITSDTLTEDFDGGMQIVKSFNWSEKYGVVRYTRYNDEVFDLLKKK